MGRFLGGIFGNTVPVSGSAGPAVFGMDGQYYLSEQGNWVAPVAASGGNIDGTAPGNGYKYHVYTSPGTFVVSSGGAVDALVVGGGGAGGRQHGGGGGGGSVAYWETMPVNGPQTYPVFVGEGGANPWPGGSDVPGNPNTAESGGNSYINSDPTTVYLRAGGGMGGGTWLADAKTNPVGGSGGGSAAGPPGPTDGAPTAAVAPSTSPSTAAVTASGGKSYQNASGEGATGGSGGGGAGAAGSDTAPPNAGGNGGAGQPFPGFALPLFPTLPSPAKTASGPTGLYAGGGGGATHGGSPAGEGGPGGGGDGGLYATPEPTSGTGTAGVALLGGGGGAGGSDDVGASAGGDGIVIIRYLAG